MNTRMLIAQSRSESRMMGRRREVVFFSILLPAMFMLLIGSTYGAQTAPNGVKIVNYLLPGYVVMAIMSVSLISLGIMTANERQNYILKRLGATPLPRSALLLGKLVSISLVVIAAILVLLALGIGIYGVTIKGSALDMAVLVLVGIVVFAMMGLMIGGLVKAEAAPAILNAFYFPLLFLGGAIIPLSQMAAWLEPIGKGLASYPFTQ